MHRKKKKKGSKSSNPLNPDFVETYYEGERKPEIVSVGRIDSNKNQKLIIDAFYKKKTTWYDILRVF